MRDLCCTHLGDSSAGCTRDGLNESLLQTFAVVVTTNQSSTATLMMTRSRHGKVVMVVALRRIHGQVVATYGAHHHVDDMTKRMTCDQTKNAHTRSFTTKT